MFIVEKKIALQLLANAGYVFLLQCLPYFHSHMNHQIKRFSIFYLWINRQTDYGLKFRYSWKSVHCRICTPKWKSLSKLQRSNSWGGGSGEKVRETTRRTDRTKRKSRILGTQKCSITIVNILLIYITRVNNSTNTKTCYDIVFHIQYGSMLLLHVSKKKNNNKNQSSRVKNISFRQFHFHI